MTNRQPAQYEMLGTVRDFGNAYKERFPKGDEGDRAFAVITAALADIDAFTRTKLMAKRVSNPSKRAAKQVLNARIGSIARSARVMAKANPGADERFPAPTRRGDAAVLQIGRLFLQEAVPVKDAFIRCGLPATFLEDLQQAVTAFEQTIRRSIRRSNWRGGIAEGHPRGAASWRRCGPLTRRPGPERSGPRRHRHERVEERTPREHDWESGDGKRNAGTSGDADRSAVRGRSVTEGFVSLRRTGHGDDTRDSPFYWCAPPLPRIYRSVKSAPTVMRATPVAARQPTGSPSQSIASRIVSGRLSLSIGATREAGAICSARK